jgi:hypothetical protein
MNRATMQKLLYGNWIRSIFMPPNLGCILLSAVPAVNCHLRFWPEDHNSGLPAGQMKKRKRQSVINIAKPFPPFPRLPVENFLSHFSRRSVASKMGQSRMALR